MATARAAFGTLLKAGDGASPEVFTALGLIKELGGPSLTANAIDVTTHNSASAFKEFIIGLKDGGEISVTLIFDKEDTAHLALLNTTFENRAVRNFQVSPAGYSPAIKWAFAAVVTKLDFKYPKDGDQTADITLKVTSKPTLS
jgi:predicted secreted protein